MHLEDPTGFASETVGLPATGSQDDSLTTPKRILQRLGDINSMFIGKKGASFISWGSGMLY
jgi:hypothetical protein